MEILGLASISKDSEFSQEIYKGVYFISHTIAIYKEGLKNVISHSPSNFFPSMQIVSVSKTEFV